MRRVSTGSIIQRSSGRIPLNLPLPMVSGRSGVIGYEALLKNIDLIRQFQSNEGMTLMDSRDKFETHQYSFSGLDDILSQFAEQISGAVGIPLVRLFGQSPSGSPMPGGASSSAFSMSSSVMDAPMPVTSEFSRKSVIAAFSVIRPSPLPAMQTLPTITTG